MQAPVLPEAVCGNIDLTEHGLNRHARSGPLLCASPACAAIARRARVTRRLRVLTCLQTLALAPGLPVPPRRGMSVVATP